MKKQLGFDGTEKEAKTFGVKLPKGVKMQVVSIKFKKPINVK